MTLAISMSRVYSSCILKYKHVTLAIGMLNDIFPLHTIRMQNYHLKHANVLH